MNADEFYALRDSRTNACVAAHSYAARRVAITVGPDAATTYAGQVAFALAVNLTARWCRHVRVGVAPARVDLRLARAVGVDVERLDDFVIQVARSADPFGTFYVGEAASTDVLELHVGADGAPARAYCIRGSGWLALGGAAARQGHLGKPDDDNPLGAALAATVGCAWLFRRALGDQHALPDAVTLSLWNLRGAAAADDGPPVLGNLGELMLVGCGAVGSAIAWLTSLTDLSARWTVVDADAVDMTNLNRSPLFTVDDVGLDKCDVVASLLRRVGAESTSVPKWFHEALAADQAFQERPDLVIPAANDRGVRHGIQQQVPPLQVYGTTNRDWQAFLGRHVPLVEDCLACRFPSVGQVEPPLACSTVGLPTSEQTEHKVDAALPFLSTAAAVLAVAELAKVVMRGGGYPVNSNFACIDFRGSLEGFFVEQRGRSAGCMCSDQRAIWTTLNGNTRHASLPMSNDTVHAASRSRGARKCGT